MSKVKVEKGTPEKLQELDVESWGTWGCEVSKFDWEYDSKETCYLYEGQVEVTGEDGEKTTFGAKETQTNDKAQEQ